MLKKYRTVIIAVALAVVVVAKAIFPEVSFPGEKELTDAINLLIGGAQ